MGAVDFDAFNTQKFLPVQINPEAMELVATSSVLSGGICQRDHASYSDNVIYYEIADCRDNMDNNLLDFFDDYFPGLLDIAFSEEVEVIQFQIA